MNNSYSSRLVDVGSAFRLPGLFFSYEELNMGNINHTYKVNYVIDDGTGVARVKPFLFQRVNTYAFKNPVQLMDNIDKVVYAASRTAAARDLTAPLSLFRPHLYRTFNRTSPAVKCIFG